MGGEECGGAVDWAGRGCGRGVDELDGAGGGRDAEDFDGRQSHCPGSSTRNRLGARELSARRFGCGRGRNGALKCAATFRSCTAGSKVESLPPRGTIHKG